MGRTKSNAIAEPLVDLSQDELNSSIPNSMVAKDAELDQQVQDDLQKNLDATQLYLGEIGYIRGER